MIHQRYLSSISSRSGPSNALSNSVLLDDDEAAGSSGKEADNQGQPPRPPPEQRIMLLQALLAIGDMSAALYFLGKFPWLAQSHPYIADLILRIIAYALEEIYRHTTRDDIVDQFDLEQTRVGRHVQGKLVTQTLMVPAPLDTSTRTFEFFYPDWHEEVESWTAVEQLHTQGMRWFSLVRGLAGRAVEVPIRLCRMAVAHFQFLRRQKEIELGMAAGAKTKAELAQVEVSERVAAAKHD